MELKYIKIDIKLYYHIRCKRFCVRVRRVRAKYIKFTLKISSDLNLNDLLSEPEPLKSIVNFLFHISLISVMHSTSGIHICDCFCDSLYKRSLTHATFIVTWKAGREQTLITLKKKRQNKKPPHGWSHWLCTSVASGWACKWT